MTKLLVDISFRGTKQRIVSWLQESVRRRDTKNTILNFLKA